MNNASKDSPARGKILIVLSAAHSIPLKEGGAHPTGIFLGELTEPLEAMLAAGYQPVFCSPQGRPPTIDADSFRLLYWWMQASKLKKAKAVLARLKDFGFDSPMSMETFAANTESLKEFDALFVPGGHGPVVDLYYRDMFSSQELNHDFGKILEYFHQQGKPTGLICHSPIALAAAPKANGKWIYSGYRITGISRLTEWINEDMPGFRVIQGHIGVYPSDVLTAAGANYVYRALPMLPFVVEDRELITAQDPFSASLMARKFVQKLERYSALKRNL